MKIQLKRMLIPENEHTRIYFSRTLLAGKPEFGERGMTVENDTLSAILEIPGVTLAEVHAYEALVSKTPMFEWAEIEPQMLCLMASLNAELPDET